MIREIRTTSCELYMLRRVQSTKTHNINETDLQRLPNIDFFGVCVSRIAIRRETFVRRLFLILSCAYHASVLRRTCTRRRGCGGGVACGRDLAAAHALPDGVLQQLVVVVPVLAADLVGALTSDARVVVGDAEHFVVDDTAQAVIVVLAEN